MFTVLSSCLLYPIIEIQSYIIRIRDKIHKNLNVLNQTVDGTKRAKFAAFARGIADNLCLLQQYKSSVGGKLAFVDRLF